MAGEREATQEVNRYGSLEDFNRERNATSFPVENLIDLGSDLGESSTPRPPAHHQMVLNHATPNCGPAQHEPRERPSLLDTSEVTISDISHKAQPTMNVIDSVTLGLNNGVKPPSNPRPTNAIRLSSDLGRRDARPSRNIDLAQYKCERCKRKGRNRSYCNSCGIVYCQSCWDQQFPHTTITSATVHERTDIRVHEILRASLRPDRTESEQKELHRRDESTTWFGVAREGEVEESTFKDHGRFWNMLKESSKRGVRNIYPGLVSFLGDTGAGKSTIIKLLIELRYRGDKEPETPVVGSLQARNRPTSGDVHLYSDPHTMEQDYPILYADCEGLEGGEIEPIGMQLNEVYGTGGRTSTRRAYYGSERPITWATTAERQSRQFAVTNLYPRLLYAFSDVVVFVLQNGREFENVAKSLLKWAAAALEKSSNQPVLPHAIIALNESPNQLPPQHWETEFATRSLLDPYRESIHDNLNFEPYVQFWRGRRPRIDSLEGLLRMYYSSVTVINIPSIGRPNLVSQQVERLYEEIKMSCKKSRAAKQSVRMLFTADELHPYLVSAFDHFATNLDEPFDFVQFSFTNSPIPLDFGGSIVKLAIKAKERQDNRVPMTDIFRELSYIIASCIMLDTARNRKIGTAEAIFPNYLGHCDDALEDFCDRSWPCEFHNRKGRCVNVKAGHQTTKGHQRKDGRVIGNGDYQSEFSAATFRRGFRDMIYNNLQQLLDRLGQMRGPNTTEAQDAAEIHSKLILQPFFEHLGGVNEFQSCSICFCCLMALPEHPLPCGHVLCTPCVRSYGSPRGKCLFEMMTCPLESNGVRFAMPCQIVLKPSTAGVRILTLDGGGIRAVAELEFLRMLKNDLGGKIPLRAFFDLIVGTNTGGMIALDLALIDENTHEDRHTDACKDVPRVTNNFARFCKTSFHHTNLFSGMPLVSKPRYHTRPLEEALKSTYTHDHLFGWSQHRATPQPKVAVTSSLNTGKAIVLSNYNRPNSDDVSYHFQRPEQAAQELKVWEAARATITVPTIFRDFSHTPSNRVYHGGSPEYINPVEVADTERKLIWPDTEHYPPDIIVSIGAGYDTSSRRPLPRANTWWWKSRSDDRVILNPLQSSSIAEDTWDHYKDSLPSKLKDNPRYVRLNVRVKDPLPILDDVDEMKDFQRQIKKLLRRRSLVSHARQIIASCFFFDVIQLPTEGGNEKLLCKGSIQCRFTDANLRHLGEYFNETRLGGDPYFSVQERDSQDDAMILPLTAALITGMIEARPFSLGPIDVNLAQKVAIIEIALHFGNGQGFPISGFPRHLQRGETRGMRLQQSHPSRWRPADRAAHREDWAGPSSTESIRPTSTLSQYGSPNYVFGKTTIPFNASELLDQPVQGRRAEMGEGRASPRPETLVNRSNLPARTSTNVKHPAASGGYNSFVEAHKVTRAHTGTRPRRQDDLTLEASTTSQYQSRLPIPKSSGNRPTLTDSVDEQSTMKQPQHIVPSGVPNSSRSNSAHKQPDFYGQQRTRPLPESSTLSDDNSSFSPMVPSNRASAPPPSRLQSDGIKGEAVSDRHRAETTPASTHQLRPRRHSSERGDRNRQDNSLPDPPKSRAQRHSVPGGRDGGGVEQQAILSSSAHPPVSGHRRRRRRRRSSGSSSRYEGRLVD